MVQAAEILGRQWMRSTTFYSPENPGHHGDYRRMAESQLLGIQMVDKEHGILLQGSQIGSLLVRR